MIHANAAADRAAIRAGLHAGPTAGLAPGHVQGNLVILPQDWANEFLRFCQANPKPCPLLAVSEVGDPMLPTLGADIDIRTDVPRYRVYRDGELAAEPTEIAALWRDDFVTFVIGCSFSFEEALLAAGVPVRHIQMHRNVPMYRTSLPCVPAGRFRGDLVVSMRPLAPADAIRAVQITSRFPSVHGAPVHLGAPERIGIADIDRPDYGDAVEIGDGELPVFWACGVTPQVAIRNARPPIAITHSPGTMLITDLLNTRLAAL
ncbi:MAG: putative hydro-lyase [Alphaproteobacteria bacterium]|jgi:uncharacterized protein YcsI (UPF0317 family)|nr:putative hydro-lyase [Alphaproteobacteria bacterium]